MNEFQNQIQRITDWWYELNFSTVQKRGLLVLGGLVIVASGFWVTTGKSEAVIMAEPIAQSQLVQQLSQVDMYKVAHHGSRYQDLNFIKALSPRISIISVGKDNTYGHPAPQTIAALSRIGSAVYRTDQDGALAINARRHQVKVRKSHQVFKFWQWG